MKNKPKHYMQLAVSKKAFNKLPDTKAERKIYIEYALDKYLKACPAKVSRDAIPDRYSVKMVTYEYDTDLLNKVQSLNTNVPLTNLVSDAILRA